MLLLLVGLCYLSLVSCHILGLEEGEICTPLRGGNGICKLILNCTTIGDFKNEHPPICSFKGKVPFVCCPNNVGTRVNVGTKVDQLCGVWNLQCLKHVDITKNLLGGVESKPRTQPFMVLIGYGYQDDVRWECGGSLISKRFVLSAAHCSTTFFHGPARWAKMGDLDLSSSSDDAKPVTKTIVERIVYPDYLASQNYHDIILFKLDSDVVFNPWVLPICLHTKREIPAHISTSIGWGRTGFAEGPSEKLLEADLNIYNETECGRLFPSSTRTPKGYQADTQFCAGTPDGSKDACGGDSGGPTVIRKPGMCVKTQIGITSFGDQCGRPDSPGVYTRVSNYIPWIEKIVFDEGNS